MDTDEHAPPTEPASQATTQPAGQPGVQPDRQSAAQSAVRVPAVGSAAHKLRGRVTLAVVVGLTCTAAGLVDGVVMIVQRRVADCEDGHYFPEGTTDFTCYSHPHAGTGFAIAGFAITLAILIGLTGAIAQWVLDARPDKARG